MKVPDGEYYVGIWVGPESEYTMAKEIQVTIQGGSSSYVLVGEKVENKTEYAIDGNTLDVSVTDDKNDNTITGYLVDSNGNIVTGIEGDVFAIKGGNSGNTLASSTINEQSGFYSIQIPSGRETWDLNYYLELDEGSSYMRSPEEPYSVQLSNNSNTVSQNITIESLSGSISGKVLLPNSQEISDEVYVFVNRIKSTGTDRPYFEDTQTTNGEFNFLLKEGYDYEVGVFLDPNSDYAEPPVQEISLVSVNSVANIELILGTADSTISGNIKLSDGSSMDEEVYVYAWSSKGQAVEGKSAADGSYSLKVASGAIWYVGSDYQRINNDGSNTNFRTAKEVTIDLLTASSDVAQDLTIFEQDYNLPTSIADSFVVSSGYTKVLDDGTEIKIPANAVPVSDTSSSVTINISPVTTGLSSTSSTKPCLLYTSPSPRDQRGSRMPSSA